MPDPQALGLRLSVNGVVRQKGSTSNMVFPVAHIIAYLSQFMVLHPGDVINTGTPAGVALGMADAPYLRAGRPWSSSRSMASAGSAQRMVQA